MKHGFLILAHKYNSAVVCLIETILSDERTHVYLHLDSKCTDDLFLNHYVNNKRVTILPRHNLHWGHTSILRQELRMLETSYLDGCGMFWLCSGDDAFTKPISECLDFVEQYRDVNFIATRPFVPCYLFWYHFGVRLQGRRYPHGWAKKLLLKQIEKQWFRKIPYEKYALGSQWWTINRIFAEFLIKESRSYRFKKTFFLSWMSDEVAVPMMARNFGFPLYSTKSQWETCENNFRLIDFSEADPSRNDPPKTFGIQDLDRVMSSPAWIVRKVDDALAEELFLLLNKRNAD